MQYNKKYKPIPEQLQLLRDRGLIIDDDAEHYLRHLNYYRLAGYWLPFEEEHASHTFKANTHFDDILNFYIFDRQLRLLFIDAIERLEVSLRTHWAHYCAKEYGPHAYMNTALSRNKGWHDKNLDLLNKEIKRSHETFIKHYCGKYSNPKNPPIWAVCEVMSLGLLSRWIKDLKPNTICAKIADTYQVEYFVLSSFVEHIAHIRNLCAHHSRVWNKKITKTLKIPKSKPKGLIDSMNLVESEKRKIYNSLVMLIHFLNIISPASQFKSKLVDLINKHSIDVSLMGFPASWETRKIWID